MEHSFSKFLILIVTLALAAAVAREKRDLTSSSDRDGSNLQQKVDPGVEKDSNLDRVQTETQHYRKRRNVDKDVYQRAQASYKDGARFAQSSDPGPYKVGFPERLPESEDVGRNVGTEIQGVFKNGVVIANSTQNVTGLISQTQYGIKRGDDVEYTKQNLTSEDVYQTAQASYLNDGSMLILSVDSGAYNVSFPAHLPEAEKGGPKVRMQVQGIFKNGVMILNQTQVGDGPMAQSHYSGRTRRDINSVLTSILPEGFQTAQGIYKNGLLTVSSSSPSRHKVRLPQHLSESKKGDQDVETQVQALYHNGDMVMNQTQNATGILGQSQYVSAVAVGKVKRSTRQLKALYCDRPNKDRSRIGGLQRKKRHDPHEREPQASFKDRTLILNQTQNDTGSQAQAQNGSRKRRDAKPVEMSTDVSNLDTPPEGFQAAQALYKNGLMITNTSTPGHYKVRLPQHVQASKIGDQDVYTQVQAIYHNGEVVMKQLHSATGPLVQIQHGRKKRDEESAPLETSTREGRSFLPLDTLEGDQLDIGQLQRKKRHLGIIRVTHPEKEGNGGQDRKGRGGRQLQQTQS